MQRRELVVLRRHALVHEVLLDQVRVLRDRGVHRTEEDALLGVLLLEPLVDGSWRHTPTTPARCSRSAWGMPSASYVSFISLGTSSQLLKRPAVGGEYRTSSSRFRPERSTPQVGIGLRRKMSSDLSRFSAIHCGSPLMRESSCTTSREMPRLATSWPCSSSLIVLFGMRVLSVAAIDS